MQKTLYSFRFPGSNSTLGILCMRCLWILRFGMGWMGSRWQEVTILGAICAKWSRSRLERWSVTLESWPGQVDTAMPLAYWLFELDMPLATYGYGTARYWDSLTGFEHSDCTNMGMMIAPVLQWTFIIQRYLLKRKYTWSIGLCIPPIWWILIGFLVAFFVRQCMQRNGKVGMISLESFCPSSRRIWNGCSN